MVRAPSFQLAGQTSPFFFDKLQSLYSRQSFIDAFGQRQIVDNLMSHDALLVNQEQPTQGHLIVDQHIVVACNLFFQITTSG